MKIKRHRSWSDEHDKHPDLETLFAGCSCKLWYDSMNYRKLYIEGGVMLVFDERLEG